MSRIEQLVRQEQFLLWKLFMMIVTLHPSLCLAGRIFNWTDRIGSI